MPFDGTMNDAALKRARLIYALRHVPATHTWDFSESGGRTNCGSYGCAVGLAYAIRLIDDPWVAVLGDALGLTRDQALRIFDTHGDQNAYGVRASEVTPEMVAAALERIV